MLRPQSLRPMAIGAAGAAALAAVLLCGGGVSRAADADAKYYKVGDTVADFDLPGLDGAKTALSSWRGKPILLNFWASW